MRDHPRHNSIRHANIFSILSSINIYPLLNTVLKSKIKCYNLRENAVCAHCDSAVNELQQLHTRRNLERHGRCTDAVETSCGR